MQYLVTRRRRILTRISGLLVGVLGAVSYAHGAPVTGSISLSQEAYPQLGRNVPTVMGRFETEAGFLFDRGKVGFLQSRATAVTWMAVDQAPFGAFEVPEAYLGTSAEFSPFRVRLGRKLESWSALDEFWEMGILQPRFRWDHFAPERVGLVGLFSEWERPGYRIFGMVSPLFVPERGGSLSVENGEVRSSDPFFSAPPSSIGFMGQNTPVRYDLKMPALSDILLRPSFLLGARVGNEWGLWAQGGIAVKPVNQILMGMEQYYSLQNESAQVVLHPRVAQHQVGTFDAGYRESRWSAAVSVLAERPIRDLTDPSWRTQEIASSLSFGPQAEWILWGERAEATALSFGYIRRLGGNLPDAGPMTDGVSSAFEPRHLFSSTVSMGFRSRLPFSWGRRWSVRSRLMYDLVSEGAFWSTQLNYRPDASWQFSLGASVIGYEPGRSDGSDFFTRYSRNDRIHGGVSYVF